MIDRCLNVSEFLIGDRPSWLPQLREAIPICFDFAFKRHVGDAVILMEANLDDERMPLRGLPPFRGPLSLYDFDLVPL